MTLREGVTEYPSLDVELVCGVSGSQVCVRGDIVEQTRIALWGVESLLLNEPRVIFDFSAVTSIDGAGLEAVLALMDSVRAHGGSLEIGCGRYEVYSAGEPGLAVTAGSWADAPRAGASNGCCG